MLIFQHILGNVGITSDNIIPKVCRKLKIDTLLEVGLSMLQYLDRKRPKLPKEYSTSYLTVILLCRKAPNFNKIDFKGCSIFVTESLIGLGSKLKCMSTVLYIVYLRLTILYSHQNNLLKVGPC